MMRITAFPSILSGVLSCGVTAVTVLGGCFDPDFGDGVACSAETPACPPDYECHPDGQCRPEGAAPRDAAEPDDGGPSTPDAPLAGDGAPPDAAADAAPAPTACEGALDGAAFCDGFEDEDLARWPSSYGDGTVERTTSTVYLGSGALRATGTADDLAAVEVDELEGLSSDVYVRAYILIPDEFAIVDVGMLYVGSSAGGIGIGVEEDEYPYVFVEAAGRGVGTSNVAFPRDVWTCLRAHIQVSNDDGAVTLWVGDELAASETGLETRADAPYTSLAVGLISPNPGGGDPTVFLDEVAIGPISLPCD